MGSCDFEIKNDVLYQYVPIRDSNCKGMFVEKEVITKEAFIKCYQEWILKEGAKEAIELG